MQPRSAMIEGRRHRLVRTCLFRLQHQRSQGKTLIHPGQLSLPLPARVPGSECRGLPLQQQHPETGSARFPHIEPPLRSEEALLSPTAPLVQSSLQVSSSLGTRARRRRARREVGSPTGYCSLLPRDSGAGAPSPQALQGAPIPGSTAHILCAAHNAVPGV